ncbi:MAG: bacterial extracellular solute-binding protein, partial [Paenibacillus sp.]|nr:bacterial extracellular solute-binding protein [Paenibacillus sp.]
MRNISKRTAATLLAVAIAAAALLAGSAGLGKLPQPGGGADRGENGGQPNRAGGPAEIGGDITFWAWDRAMRAITPELERFRLKYPQVTVHTVVLSGEEAYRKLLLANASNGVAPDVAAIPKQVLGRYIEIGALLELSDRVRASGLANPGSGCPDATRENRCYAVPWDLGPVGLFYRRDVFEGAGFASDPESVSALLATWDDYLRVGKTIKEKTGAYMNAMPLETGEGVTTLFEYMLSQDGKLYVDEAGQVVIRSPLALTALNKLIEMNDAGITLSAQAGTRPYNGAVERGIVATIAEPVWMGGTLRDIAPGSSGLWGVAQLPAWFPGGSRSADAGGSYLGISRLSANIPAAWAFIEYMLGKPGTVNSMFRRADLFPALEEAYADPMYDEPLAFFAGQRTRRFFVQQSREAKPAYFSDDFRDMRKIAELELFKAIKGVLSPE